MARQKPISLRTKVGNFLGHAVRSTWLAFVAILVTVIALNHLGAINHALDFLGRGLIADANTLFIHKAKTNMAETIVTLTALDTGLEVLKSSTAGVSFIASFDVQVGNIVATVQDAAHKALMASLAAASSFVAIELLLDLAKLISAPLLTLTIVTTGVHYAVRGHWRWMSLVSGQLSEIMILVSFMAHIGLPLAIYGSSLASNSVTAPVAAAARQHFEQTRSAFPDHSKEKLDEHLKNVKEHYKETSTDAHNQGRLLSHSMVRHVTAILFDALLFPAFMVLLVLWVGKVVTRHTLRIGELMDLESLQGAEQRKILGGRRR